MSQYHIIGAGMAGLAAAVKLASIPKLNGKDINLYETAPQAGGRCRSFVDATLGCEIDNGNHLLLSGNYCAMEYLDITNAADQLIGPDRAAFPFTDIRNAQRWDVEFNRSKFPFWIFNKNKRVPQAGVLDHLKLISLMRAKDTQTIEDIIAPDHPLYERLIDPLSVAVINMTPDTASAKLMRNVLAETALKGGRACQPRIARHSLAQTFVDPAIKFLKDKGVNIHMGARLKAITYNAHNNKNDKAQWASELEFTDMKIQTSRDDTIILALPPAPASQILDGIDIALDYSAIANLHFKLDAPIDVDWPAPIMGIIGGVSQWVFIRGSIASVTISAANELLTQSADELTQTVWNEIADILGQDKHTLPPVRVIKEKRASLQQGPALETQRPACETGYDNLFLAGDWTDTGLPATIEGAIRSGYKAAQTAQKSTAQKSMTKEAKTHA